jgi:uncharacterized integral membrane protein
MRTVRRLLALAVFVAALVLGWSFAGRNPEPVSIEVPGLAPLPPQPLWLALLASFAIGAVLAGLLGLYQSARLSLTARRWRKLAGRLESELHQLRNLPLAGQQGAGRRTRKSPPGRQAGSPPAHQAGSPPAHQAGRPPGHQAGGPPGHADESPPDRGAGAPEHSARGG